MKCIAIAGIAALTTVCAMSARAQEPTTTLQQVTAHGIVIKVYGMDIPVTYTADGKWTGGPAGQKMEGVWRIDGDKLCTRTGTDPEVCPVYPAGKKSGDEFDVPGALGPQMGTVKVRIY